MAKFARWRNTPEIWRTRSRATHWLLVALAVIAAAVLAERSVRSTRADAESIREAWGTGVRVLVADAPAIPGDTLGAASLRWIEAPSAVVPADALLSPPDLDSTFAQAVSAGTVLTHQHLTASSNPVVHQLTRDERAIAIATDGLGPPLMAGDPIELVVSGRDAASATFPARVISAGDDQLVAAIAPAAVPTVAPAARRGEVSVALRPR